MMCRVCCPEERKKAPSQHEIDAWQVLKRMKDQVPEWRVEERVLGGNWAAADIYFPSIQGIIMIDGEHHFPEGSGQRLYGRDGYIQQLNDLVYNVIAVASGFHILRLHYQDKGLWAEAIHGWVKRCAAQEAPDLVWVPQWKYVADACKAVAWRGEAL